MKLSEKTVKVHMYDVSDVLKPRGSMCKESIGAYLLQRLEDAYESWTDQSHADNPTKEELMVLLENNLNSEVTTAWMDFRNSLKK